MTSLKLQFPDLFSSWFIFTATMLAVCFAIGLFTLWLVLRKKDTRRKRKSRHHEHYRRQKNPSRAETGGLPPTRQPGQLPPGP